MDVYKLTETEEKFAEIVWNNEPIGSGDLVNLCAKEMGWKKSTTYTVLKKLCEKAFFRIKMQLLHLCFQKTNIILSRVYVLLRITLADLCLSF